MCRRLCVVYAPLLLASFLLSSGGHVTAQAHPVEVPEYRPPERPPEPYRGPDAFRPDVFDPEHPNFHPERMLPGSWPSAKLRALYRQLNPPLDVKSETADQLFKVKTANNWSVAVRGNDGIVRYAINDWLEGTTGSYSVSPGTRWVLREPSTPEAATAARKDGDKEEAFPYFESKEGPIRLGKPRDRFPRMIPGEPIQASPFSSELPFVFRAYHPVFLNNTIKLDRKTGDFDLTPFVEVNNRLAADFTNDSLFDEYSASPLAIPGLKMDRSTILRLHLGHMMPTMAMTSAKLADGSYMVTLFDLRRAATDGRLAGDVYTISGRGGLRIEELGASLWSGLGKGSHLYVYGDVPQQLGLSWIISGCGAEVVRRTKWTSRDLFTLERRLHDLSSISMDADSTIVLNALPAREDEARALGPLAGKPETWIDFHRRVSELAESTKSAVLEHDKLFSELNEGEKNVVFIVAHSTGLKLFVGGKAISIDELRKLKVRKKSSDLPRMAVLLVCHAGTEKPQARWSFFHKDLPNLADTLLSKGYFDLVIAPDHPIQSEETLDVLQKLRAGGADAKLPTGWIRRSSIPRISLIRGG